MAADEQRNEDLIEYLLLAHDHLPHLAQNLTAHCVEALDALLQENCIFIQSGKRCRRSH